MKGVIDRFENDKAIVLIEKQNDELMIPIDQLPEGCRPNTYLTLKKQAGKVIVQSIDHDKTKQETQKSADLLAKLRNKSSGSKFKKK